MRLSFIDNDMLCRSGFFKAGLTVFSRYEVQTPQKECLLFVRDEYNKQLTST